MPHWIFESLNDKTFYYLFSFKLYVGVCVFVCSYVHVTMEVKCVKSLWH